MRDTSYPDDDEDEIDRVIRIEKIKRELDEVTGGKMLCGSFGKVPTEIEALFLEHVLAYERAEFDTNFNRLVQRGVALPPAAEIDDATLREKLAEVTRELMELRCFLYHTDHLSDRELYEWLWGDGLREESAEISGVSGAWHTSPIGGGSEQDTQIWLRYYASDEERQRWRLDYPEDSMPIRESPPFDRDQHQPKQSPF
jgi:hypothetical protein